MLSPGEPEHELLFQLVASAAGDDRVESVKKEIVHDDPDWGEIARLASRHGLSAQLYQLLNALEEGVPEGIREELQTQYRENALNNLQYAQHLHELLKTFGEHDIRAIPYKGPTLAEYAYGGLDRRWFGDLDILIPEEDILRARKLLLHRGYEQTNARGVSPSALVKGSVFRWEREFRLKRDNVRVELRYQFTGGEQRPDEIFEDLWSRRVELSLAGKTLDTLSPEDRVMLLLRHGTKHGWCRLSWVYDMARVIQQDIEWEVMLARSERYGWITAVLLGLALTAELADVEIPRCARREIAENSRARWGAPFLTTLFQKDPTGESLDLDPLTIVLFMNDSLESSIRECFDVVFSPSVATHDLLPLPPALYPLYYLLRPVELGLKLLQ